MFKFNMFGVLMVLDCKSSNLCGVNTLVIMVIQDVGGYVLPFTSTATSVLFARLSPSVLNQHDQSQEFYHNY